MQQSFVFLYTSRKQLEKLNLKIYLLVGSPACSVRGFVAEMRKFTWTTILWKKRDGMATLSRGEHGDPCLDRLLLLFWAHYIEDGPHLLCTGSALGGYLLQKTKERMLLITSKRKDICKYKGKSG